MVFMNFNLLDQVYNTDTNLGSAGINIYEIEVDGKTLIDSDVSTSNSNNCCDSMFCWNQARI